MNNTSIKNRRLVIILLCAVLVMFGFAFALVPLYNVFCQVFGINGKPNSESLQNYSVVDKSRNVTIQLIAHTDPELPWKFYPALPKITIHPGQSTKIYYIARNLSNHNMTVRAVPSVSPGNAAKHLKKTECFCFSEQKLASNRVIKMPIVFYIDPELPKSIKEITLSYTLYKKKSNPVITK